MSLVIEQAPGGTFFFKFLYFIHMVKFLDRETFHKHGYTVYFERSHTNIPVLLVSLHWNQTNKQINYFDLWSSVFIPLCLKPLLAPGGASESSAPSGLPAAEFGSPGSAAAEAMEPGEDPAGARVSAPQTGLVTAQPQATLLPQTVEARLQGHRVERHLGGMRG